MKRISLTILSCLMTTTAYAEAVDKTIDASPDGQVEISNIAGSIVVVGWSRDAVQVTGNLGKNVEELILERDGDDIFIKVKVPSKGHNRSIGSDLRISVPQNSSIDVGAVSADIDVSNVRGEQSLHTVSGNVDAEHSGGALSAESVSGDVEIEGNNSDGEVSASTVSGNVAVFRVSGELVAEAVSGDVVVDEGSFDRAQLEAVSGDLRFEAELRKGGKLVFETVNGDIDVDFVGAVSAGFDIDTFNGNIRNCFGPKPVRASKYVPSLELSFEEGNGDGDVEISAVNGDVSLCKK